MNPVAEATVAVLPAPPQTNRLSESWQYLLLVQYSTDLTGSDFILKDQIRGHMTGQPLHTWVTGAKENPIGRVLLKREDANEVFDALVEKRLGLFHIYERAFDSKEGNVVRWYKCNCMKYFHKIPDNAHLTTESNLPLAQQWPFTQAPLPALHPSGYGTYHPQIGQQQQPRQTPRSQYGSAQTPLHSAGGLPVSSSGPAVAGKSIPRILITGVPRGISNEKVMKYFQSMRMEVKELLENSGNGSILVEVEPEKVTEYILKLNKKSWRGEMITASPNWGFKRTNTGEHIVGPNA